MRQILLLLTLTFLTCLGQQVTVTQDEKLLVLKVGESINLKCEHSDKTGTFTMFWYQQISGKGLELMAMSTAVNDSNMEKKFNDLKWSLERSDVKASVLKRDEATSGDSAVYFCALRDISGGTNTAKLEFGGGTVLSVLGVGEQVRAPKVTIYAPNKNELEDNNDFISLVCIASNFFPEHVKIRWFVNNEERVNLYEPIPQIKEDNSSYSTSKRLILTKSEYFNVDSVFRCQAAFLNGDHETSVEVTGEAGCGMSKESYSMRINEGKISYIIVLCKSGLYALIVLALLWRKKLILSSY